MPEKIIKDNTASTKAVDLSDKSIFAEENAVNKENIASKAVVETPSALSMRERIGKAEGGSWIMYHDALAERFGKAYSVTILPITYSFQEGLKTFVLEEHEKHIWDIFNRALRAKGQKITNTDIFSKEDPTKMIQG